MNYHIISKKSSCCKNILYYFQLIATLLIVLAIPLSGQNTDVPQCCEHDDPGRIWSEKGKKITKKQLTGWILCNVLVWLMVAVPAAAIFGEYGWAISSIVAVKVIEKVVVDLWFLSKMVVQDTIRSVIAGLCLLRKSVADMARSSVGRIFLLICLYFVFSPTANAMVAGIKSDILSELDLKVWTLAGLVCVALRKPRQPEEQQSEHPCISRPNPVEPLRKRYKISVEQQTAISVDENFLVNACIALK